VVTREHMTPIEKLSGACVVGSRPGRATYYNGLLRYGIAPCLRARLSFRCSAFFYAGGNVCMWERAQKFDLAVD
jgi:hypothetical protein